MLELRPVFSGHLEVMYPNKEEPLIRGNPLSRRQLEGRFSLRHLWAGIVDVETRFLKHLSASCFLEAFAHIDGPSRSCPEDLTGKRPLSMLEPEQKKPVSAV